MDSDPTIRRATVTDAEAIAAIYAPHCETSAVSFETVAPSADEMARRISRVGAERPWLVLDEGGSVAGYAYAGPHHERAAYGWAVSTSVYVSADHRRRGAGRALYAALFDMLRCLGYFRATAGITLPNAASVGLHAAFGFTLVGVYRDIGYKFGTWHDVAWYEAEIQPLTADPSVPLPISTLEGSPAWDEAVGKGLVHFVHRG